MIRYIFILLSLLLLPISAISAVRVQPTVSRVVNSGLYVEKFKALKSDTACKHGNYQLLYKNMVIEQGSYHRNQKVGEWSYYNLNKQIEFVYNYDDRTVSKVMPHVGTVYTSKEMPALFLGSPLIPHVFVSHNVFYPIKEHGTSEDCTVTLALKINSRGVMTGFYLKQTSKPAFNEAVLKVAATMPKHWRWVPARSGGRFIDSEYIINIIFDASN